MSSSCIIELGAVLGSVNVASGELLKTKAGLSLKSCSHGSGDAIGTSVGMAGSRRGSFRGEGMEASWCDRLRNRFGAGEVAIDDDEPESVLRYDRLRS